MLPRSLHLLISGILLYLPSSISQQRALLHIQNPIQDESLIFELRHVHAVSQSSRNIFADISNINTNSVSKLSTRRISAHKPRLKTRGDVYSITGWEEEPIVAPDVKDRETVLELAKMTNNAYVQKGENDWYDIGDGWDHEPFGWEPDADGFRGHVFVSTDNSTVVLTIKGTSPALFGGGGPTGKKDKLNDNLLFSCCCARVSYTWRWSTVCDCFQGGTQCSNDCLEDALVEESLFYPIGTNLYNNLTYMYPNANIWLSGHSLGGALASLIGITFGVPVVTFESPGEALAAKRLHLPLPPTDEHITHFYHTADPIPNGVCTGALSSCSIGGYAMETKCHLGLSAVFDTVRLLGWSGDVRTHGIQVVINDLLEREGKWAKKRAENDSIPVLPEAKPEDEDCLASECYSWDFI